MMKKFFVAMAVLSIASLASAGLTISGYDGQVLNPSDTITLQIVADQVGPAGYAYTALVADQNGKISGGTKGLGSLTGDNAGTTIDFFPLQPGQAGIDWYVGDSTGAVLNGVVVGEITFHCEGPGVSVVELWVTPDFVGYELADTVSISQVPEPATMALLGLGALVLRRRK